MNTFTKRIAAGADDGYTNLGLGFDNSTVYVAFGNISPNGINAFLRFTNVTIPQGAVITSAKITFQAQASQSGASCITKIFCNDEDNATAPTDASTHSAKSRTTAYANWTADAQTAGSNYDSADFTTAVQEVVNRAGWVSGNALMVLIDDNSSTANAYRLEDSYDSDAANAALLTVTYEDAGDLIMLWSF